MVVVGWVGGWDSLPASVSGGGGGGGDSLPASVSGGGGGSGSGGGGGGTVYQPVEKPFR